MIRTVLIWLVIGLKLHCGRGKEATLASGWAPTSDRGLHPKQTVWYTSESCAVRSSVPPNPRPWRGDPVGQARLEAYTLLQSVYLWRKVIKEAQGSLAAMGDALGVLHDARKFRARDPVLNEIRAVVALITAPPGQDIRTLHLWTRRDQLATR